jgi:hypothetical protein
VYVRTGRRRILRPALTEAIGRNGRVSAVAAALPTVAAEPELVRATEVTAPELATALKEKI